MLGSVNMSQIDKKRDKSNSSLRDNSIGSPDLEVVRKHSIERKYFGSDPKVKFS